MTPTLPLDQMNLAEKLQVMESLWADLSRKESGFTPPEWHQDVLAERKQQLEAGEIAFTDWEQAKRDIDDAV